MRTYQSAKIKFAMARGPLKGYLCSIPERFLRSLTGLGGGAARELSEVLLPARVRRSRLYQSLVGSTLRFLIEQVGPIKETYDADTESLPSDFLIRRAAGNVVELAGIASFHASPVWVLAALADVAGAGRELIGEMAEALQKEGLVPPGHKFHTVDQLLGGLERTAGRLTETVNTPPLDVASLRAEWAEFRREASRLSNTKTSFESCRNSLGTSKSSHSYPTDSAASSNFCGPRRQRRNCRHAREWTEERQSSIYQPLRGLREPQWRFVLPSWAEESVV
jgi:hypothetical protein